jgi:two-component system cell cycle response regulator DivK
VKIVVVAENGFMRSSIHVNLLSSGHEVSMAEPTGLLDVLGALREAQPHLVVLDYLIPQCHSETVIRTIREDPILAGTPILLIFEDLGSLQLERLKGWGRMTFLPKPVQVAPFLQAVARTQRRTAARAHGGSLGGGQGSRSN